MKKARAAFLNTLLFGIVLSGVYFVHVRWLPVNVVFFSAMIDVTVAAIVSTAILFFIRPAAVLNSFEKTLLVVIWLLLGYAFAISVPTVIDRSLSFYILEKIQQRGGGIQESAFADIFVNEYMVEHRLVDIRLTEQLESGTITIDNGCVRLTGKGERIAEVSRFFRRNLLPRNRLIRGEYTDDLTDPFRFSAPRNDYLCD
jgi:hypothetical protein